MNFYQVGGSLPQDTHTYVIREADFDFFKSVVAGEFCYVLSSRQMGKSSLRVQTMQRLQAEGIACAAIDMTSIGTSDITPEQWYAGVIYSLISSLELYESFDLETWWTQRAWLPCVQRFSRFLEEVLLTSIPNNIVIFVDEIDSILSLNFHVDDFFSLIGYCYNERASRPEYKRLTFTLLGVATLSDLIQETNSHSTPFNSGRAIELKGFQLEEAQPLAQGLATVASNSEAVLAEVLAWTGGQPFLTQKVCKLILTNVSSIPIGREAEVVENLVRSRIILNWEVNDEPEHLRTIRTRLLTDEQRAGRLLGLYQQILKQGQVAADESSEHQQLRLTGLVVRQQGFLRVFNRIYQEVFNPAWVEKELDNLRPYSKAFRNWVNSGCQDISQLLQGQALQEALMWAEGKRLSNLDDQFLAASQGSIAQDSSSNFGTDSSASQQIVRGEVEVEAIADIQQSRNVRDIADKLARGGASRYWRLVRIDAAGQRKVEVIASAREFFLASFPQFIAQSEVPDSLIQRQLLQWMKEAVEEDMRLLARRCLQCFISSQIEKACQKLEVQFGTGHGFTCSDLLPFVLDDNSTRPNRDSQSQVSSAYQSLMQEILKSFDPTQSSLATWTSRRVRHHKELNAFLLEHGVYLVSDWAILNDTNPKQLQRIFSQFHQLTDSEISKASRVLESYHAVYRIQRLKQRQMGIKGQCQPPTSEQLNQIAQHLSRQTNQMLSPETLMTQLQAIAFRLREFRIHVRRGSVPIKPIDIAANDRLPFQFVDNRDSADEESEFLYDYRKKFSACLDEAIAHVTEEQVRKLQQKDPQKAEKFVTAMQLFCCERKSMGEIAKEVNLKAQYAVAKLLKLKSFRADVRQQLLVRLRDRVIEQAQAYTDPERLQALSQQIEEALNEQVATLIQEAAAEASRPTDVKKKTPTSLFTKRLCRYLDTRKLH